MFHSIVAPLSVRASQSIFREMFKKGFVMTDYEEEVLECQYDDYDDDDGIDDAVEM